MNPFHFGKSPNRLFGVYHPPTQETISVGIVLSQSLFDEYYYAHRAVRTLAVQLANHGIPTLRFDYYGTGDSDGCGEDLTLSQCSNDIQQAAHELREISGVRRINLAGMRMGAYLAAKAATGMDMVDGLVLWDPVTDGEKFLKQRELKHRENLSAMPNQEKSDHSQGILGSPLTSELRAEICGLDFTSIDLGDTSVMVLVDNETPQDKLRVHWTESRLDLTWKSVPSKYLWEEQSGFLVDPRVPEEIVVWTQQQ